MPLITRPRLRPIIALAPLTALTALACQEVPRAASGARGPTAPAGIEPAPAAPIAAEAAEPAPEPAPLPPVSPGLELQDEPYAEARAKFKTKLISTDPAPQRYQNVPPPPGAREISYLSGGLKLKAWVSEPPADGRRLPAVLFLHGGFAFALEDWEMAAPYRDAGFVVLMPMLRGENGLPGGFSMFFHEVDDVLAAADALAKLPYVQPDRLHVAGHSVGGTLTLLAAMGSDRFRAAASFSGSPNQIDWSSGQTRLIPFSPYDIREFQIRSPVAYATSFRCPVRLYHGLSGGERFFGPASQRLALLAQRSGLDVKVVPVAGDHFTSVPEAMRQSIEFFREQQ
ncbi:alpha/beta fold hydrolase [Sorangium sp. So ce327]|uniref:alpha/beta hydrolase family protein n=1 Tax=Sorangium sp. So ce327 TaxID=3133301 RepID=UPI003F623E93